MGLWKKVEKLKGFYELDSEHTDTKSGVISSKNG